MQRLCGTGGVWLVALAAAAFTGGGAKAQPFDMAAMASGAPQTLDALSIDELSQINVTSVSKRPEQIRQAASSVYVITNDDIARSGALSLPEVLRLAPSLEVMRVDGLDYSITARGFSGLEAANKLLVLVDGRSVYTPLSSGVDWDQHNLLLDDVDRIEVISGPGGTLWGANAVNGVVNVITRSAFDTEGALVAANLGTLDSDVRLRFARQLGDSGAGRIHAIAFKRGDLQEADGSGADDGWDGWQVGFRTDWARGLNSFTLQGDLQDSRIDDSLGPQSGYVRGGNVVGRWTHRAAKGVTWEAQGYYDLIEREARGYHDEQRVWDVQGQVSLTVGGAHQVVAGAGYRVTDDEFRLLDTTAAHLLKPPKRQVGIGNVFIQDEISLRSNLTLTLGVKLESNSFTRSEWMPSARLGWRVTDRQFLWAAVSRAIRNPSRIERDFFIEGIVDPGRMGSEKLVAYELGYRGRLGARVSASATAFFHDYTDLRTNDFTPPGVFPIFVGNSQEGETFGLEAWGDLQVTDAWRLSLGGSLLETRFRLKPGSLDVAGFESGGNDPSYWIKLRSLSRLSERLSLDLSLRAIDGVPQGLASGYVGADAYVEANLRLGWQINDSLELSLSGQNLLQPRHAEASETRRNEIPRSALVGLRWRR